jgi:hypothetical protein
MELWQQIIESYPELADNDFADFSNGTIRLQDDSDGEGAFIAVWNYSKPLPAGLKVGK